MFMIFILVRVLAPSVLLTGSINWHLGADRYHDHHYHDHNDHDGVDLDHIGVQNEYQQTMYQCTKYKFILTSLSSSLFLSRNDSRSTTLFIFSLSLFLFPIQSIFVTLISPQYGTELPGKETKLSICWQWINILETSCQVEAKLICRFQQNRQKMEKNLRSAANATMLRLMQVPWGHIWKHTVEKSQTNATSVTIPLLR